MVDGIFTEAEVLYAAPDAPAVTAAPASPDEDEDEDEDLREGEDDEDDDEGPEDLSHWRNGLPPLEQAVPFPIERYPEAIVDYDGERFGVALKLGGAELPGEESVINAFFALWLSAYQDERIEELEPFQRADVVHDRRHRSALMWVERFAVPATASEQVHFLLWIVARINDVLSVSWARFRVGRRRGPGARRRRRRPRAVHPRGQPVRRAVPAPRRGGGALVGRVAERVVAPRARRDADRGRARAPASTTRRTRC